MTSSLIVDQISTSAGDTFVKATTNPLTGGIELSAGGVVIDMPTATSTTTLTNKRITPRIVSASSSATPTINTDVCDIYKLTAQAVDITSMTTNLSGAPSDGQVLIIEITGTAARAITWGTSFEASTKTLPTTTTATDLLTVGLIYNVSTGKWRCMGVS